MEIKKNLSSNSSHALNVIQKANLKRKIVYAALALIFISLIAFIFYYQKKPSLDGLIANEYSQIENIYNQESLDYQKKSESQIKNEEVDLEDFNIDYSKSAPLFLEFALKYPKNPFAWQAAIRASDYFIKNDNLLQAQRVLEAVLPYTLTKSWVQIKLRTTLAGIYATQKNVDKAIEQLTIVENYPHNPFQNQSRLLKAQLFLANKNYVEAKKILNQIISTPREISNSDINNLNPDSSHLNDNDKNDIHHQALVLLNRIGY